MTAASLFSLLTWQSRHHILLTNSYARPLNERGHLITVGISTKRIMPAALLLLITACNAALVPAVALQYSYDAASVAASWAGFLILLALIGLLAILLARPGLRQILSSAGHSITLGMILGLLWVVEISINNFVAPSLPARDIIDNIFWAIIGLSILVFACVSAQRADRIRAGVEVGAWSGLASGAVACCMALSLIVFGMGAITRDPLNVAEWATRGPESGAPTMASYFAYQTFAGAFLHLIVLGGLMGVLLGGLGGAMGKAIKLASRPVRRLR